MYAILMLLNYTICNAFCNFRDYYKSYISISTIYIYAKTHQLGPRYEGQLMSDGGA